MAIPPENTCDQCEHFTPALPNPEILGTCALNADANKTDASEESSHGWAREGYVAGVYVGTKLGCVHWEKKK